MALSDDLEALAKRHGALSYRNRADTQHPAYGFTEDGLNGLIGEVLAKWSTPQPVVREPLTDSQAQPVAREPLSAEQYNILVEDLSEWSRHVEVDTAPRSLEEHIHQVFAIHGIKGGQHGTE